MSPSKIDWCDETINPQGWGCWGPGGTPDKPQRCWYCYVERQAKGPYVPDCEMCRQLIPHWHPERLEIPLRWRKPRRIFWQSMGDLWHPFSPFEQIAQVMRVVRATPQHSHVFCTKNPIRYADWSPWPDNCWLLTTITGLGPEEERIDDLLRSKALVKGISFEPLLGPIRLEKRWLQIHTDGQWLNVVECGQKVQLQHLNWLIIGAYTGKGASRFVPAAAWVQGLIDQGRAAGVPLLLKNNLNWPEKIQEFPA